MNGLGLSAEQIAERRNYVCAGDATKIMAGDWISVWREKRGEAGVDLSDVLPVQMGSYTEPLNLAWYMKQTGRPVSYYSGNPLMQAAWLALTGQKASPRELVVSTEFPWMACNLDAMSHTSHAYFCVLDAKHVGQFRYEELVARYTAAGVHQAIVCGVDWWALSVLIGNGKWELVEQPVDPFYREHMIAAERDFWSWVERGEEPPDMTEPVPAPKPAPRLRKLDASAEFGSPEWQALVKNNNWLPDCANEIAAFAETDGAAKRHAISREAIKAALPDDIGELVRTTKQGIFTAKRSRAGSVTMTLDKSAPEGE